MFCYVRRGVVGKWFLVHVWGFDLWRLPLLFSHLNYPCKRTLVIFNPVFPGGFKKCVIYTIIPEMELLHFNQGKCFLITLLFCFTMQLNKFLLITHFFLILNCYCLFILSRKFTINFAKFKRKCYWEFHYVWISTMIATHFKEMSSSHFSYRATLSNIHKNFKAIISSRSGIYIYKMGLL